MTAIVAARNGVQDLEDHNFAKHYELPAEGNEVSMAKNVGGSSVNPSELSKKLILSIMRERASRVDSANCQPGDDDPFYVADLGEVYRQFLRWQRQLPRVRPFYAVKCNPDRTVLRLLSYLGCGFDCASKGEIDMALSSGIAPNDIIYAQPCKTTSFLRHAGNAGVMQMTFDNADELHKIKQVCPNAELYLRILTDDSASTCRLSMKFGAPLTTTQALLELARQLGLNVVGVSFHVGSGAADPGAFLDAIKDSRAVFDQASSVGYNLHMLDIGGGFSDDTFDEFGKTISQALDEHFPQEVRIIAEPGRYFVASAFTLAANVIARRNVTSEMGEMGGKDRHLGLPEKEAYMLYLNDGVYGNFSNIIFDHQQPVPRVLLSDNERGINNPCPVDYSIWGPTCDGIDMIAERCVLPGRISVGDWLYFDNMGAYTSCSRTKFNGFTDSHEVIYICSEPLASMNAYCLLCREKTPRGYHIFA